MLEDSSNLDKIEAITTSIYRFESVTVNQKGEIIKQVPGQAKYFQEDLGHDVLLEMVYIPGGKFLMGSPASENKTGWSQGREEPQHIVTLPSFWMGKYAVTQEQWQLIMRNNPSWFKGTKRPVENVSWDMCQEFCQKLSATTGKLYQLPSEAQWEYGCRAGTTSPFHYGETLTTTLANYDGSNLYGEEKKGLYRKETVEVGSFAPNNFGLYDMHGNVWEWCQDRWHDHYQGIPNDGTAWEEESSATKKGRVMRGGSWHSHPIYCRSANRFHCNHDFVISYLGLRLICSIQNPIN